MILPVVINSYLSKTYQITYFSLFNNILDNLNPLYFFCIVIQSDWLLTFVTLNDFLLQNCGGRKKSSSNIWHDFRNYFYCKCKNVNLGRFSPKKYCQPHILKRSNPFLNLLDTLTLRETNKVHLSHKKEGVSKPWICVMESTPSLHSADCPESYTDKSEYYFSIVEDINKEEIQL